MNKTEELIASLSRDLEPVLPAPNVNVLAAMWLLLGAGFMIALIHLAGPIRPGAFEQLGTEQRFRLETILGVVSIAWLTLAAFRSAVPGALSRKFAVAGLVLMALWLTQYVVGLVNPALEPSMLGKREHCYLETMLYSLVPIMAAVYLVRKLYPLRFVRTGMALGLAAGMVPALYMQLACVYEPTHILSLHILPGLAMVLVGAAVAALWRRRNRARP